jgi:eukaryotic-like serine/threonine-protein kinase
MNSANYSLSMQRGVGAALRLNGGESIELEAKQHGEQALGECIHTSAGALGCRGVLHAVGAWKEVSCISRAIQRALLVAEEHGYQRIALPAIGTGDGRVSLEACADAMVSALARHLALGGSRLTDVCFVLVDAATRERFVEVARSILFDGHDPGGLDDAMDAPPASSEAASAPTLFAPSGPCLARHG